MQDDCIAVALGLPQLRILKQKELEDHFEVTVIYRRENAICPRCGKVASKEHDRRPQLKQDRRLRNKMVFLILMKRRLQRGNRGRSLSSYHSMVLWLRFEEIRLSRNSQSTSSVFMVEPPLNRH